MNPLYATNSIRNENRNEFLYGKPIGVANPCHATLSASIKNPTIRNMNMTSAQIFFLSVIVLFAKKKNTNMTAGTPQYIIGRPSDIFP